MLRIDGLPSPGAVAGPSVATIGVFDGLHVGHRRLLATLAERARDARAASVVLTFRRHPDALLRDAAPTPLMTLEDRLDGIAALGVDACITLDFDHALRSMRVEDFLADVLRAGMGCERLVLGHDSALCRNREGTAERFTELGLPAERVERVSVDGHTVSASAIRDALRLGDVERARALLGRPFAVRGCVVHGDARGRELGFPTANLRLPELCLPRDGVYAARATSPEFDAEIPAVVNLGLRPTFGPGARSLEAHLLDGFDRSLYGAEVELHFVARLRDERRFDGRRALLAQIEEDIAAARRALDVRDRLS